MTKELYVDTEALKAVASQINSLLEKINSQDATKGTISDFQSAASIEGPTKTFWSGPNALATAYGQEFKYVNETYKSLVQQLNAVMQACTNTATEYGSHEKKSKQDVKTGTEI